MSRTLTDADHFSSHPLKTPYTQKRDGADGEHSHHLCQLPICRPRLGSYQRSCLLFQVCFMRYLCVKKKAASEKILHSLLRQESDQQRLENPRPQHHHTFIVSQRPLQYFSVKRQTHVCSINNAHPPTSHLSLTLFKSSEKRVVWRRIRRSERGICSALGRARGRTSITSS